MNFLRIAARIAEIQISAIRSKKFDLSEFKKLTDIIEINTYARETLERIGSGSSRYTYVLTSKRVLKVANNWMGGEVGQAQNEAEVNIYTNPKTKPIITKIFDFDPEYKWLISEAVRPLRNYEFEKLVGCNLSALLTGLDYINDYPDWFSESDKQEQREFEQKYNVWLEALENLNNIGIDLNDLYSDHQWGKTPDGRVVVLDYGFTDDTRHYYDEDTGSGSAS